VETNLYVAKGLLIPYGLKIDLVTSGFEAIKKIKNGDIYDVVFMDHMMPNMDGVETTRLLRDMGYVFPIVALTANAVVGQAEIYLQSGFDDFVSKPIDIRQLNVVLNKLIRDKQPPEVIENARSKKTEMEKNSSAPQQISRELAGIFIRDAGKALGALETVAQNGFRETQAFIINVHAMKSALANIGEAQLSAAAAKLEQAARDAKINTIKAETPAFLNELKKIIEKLKSAGEQNKSGEDTEEDLAYLREKLLEIKEACAALDKKAVKKNLAVLREITWAHNTAELLNKIAEYLLHSEFDEITALVNEMVKE